MNSILNQIAAWYEQLASPRRIHWYEKWVVGIALSLFLGHLLLIFLTRAQIIDMPFIDRSSYLATIQTPFTVILYFEVFLLILSLAKPLTASIGKQFEIATLLIIRDVFKYLSQIETGTQNLTILPMIGVSLFASIIVFALVGIFYFVIHQKQALFKSDKNLTFNKLKKAVALVFCLYLLSSITTETVLAISSLFNYFATGSLLQTTVAFDHYRDIMTAMIFADVFIFILSLLYLSAYRHVFIESSLIISTILIRLSFTFTYPVNILINSSAILFGVIVISIYAYYEKYQLGSEED